MPAYVRAAEKAEMEARDAYTRAKHDLEDEIRKREWAARDRIREELADRQRVVDELRAAQITAQQVLDSERVRAAHEDESAVAVGTIMVEWVRPRSYGSEKYPARPARRGRLEIWTPESKSPDNVRWGLPSPGERYIRLFKKDGTDSLKLERLSSWHSGDWLPEGQKPQGQK